MYVHVHVHVHVYVYVCASVCVCMLILRHVTLRSVTLPNIHAVCHFLCSACNAVCSLHGSCQVDGSCICDTGYSGPLCSVNMNTPSM